jgi:general secretion pathway protein G
MIKKNAGFTLFEILLVVGIIVFLMAMLLPRIFKYMGRTDQKKIELKMNKIKEALVLYKQDMGHYPTKKEGGLEALLSKPNVSGSERWVSKYLDDEDDLLGANNMAFEFNAPPVKHKDKYHSFEIISEGEEGKETTAGF